MVKSFSKSFLEVSSKIRTLHKRKLDEKLETVFYIKKSLSHMKGCWAITFLTEIKHFLCEKKVWKDFWKVFQKGIFKCACSRKTLILVKVLVQFCSRVELLVLSSCIFFSGVIFPLFWVILFLSLYLLYLVEQFEFSRSGFILHQF